MAIQILVSIRKPADRELVERTAPALPRTDYGCGERVGGALVERAVQIAEDFEGGLRRRLRNQTRDLPAIADQHDFLLLALDAIENGAEIPGDFGDAQGFHGRTISDRI